MTNTTSPAFSPTRSVQAQSYKLLGELEVDVALVSNPCGLEQGDLFRMAARINKKRGFLFVSTVLGKHIPVDPALSLACGATLGRLYASASGAVPGAEGLFDGGEALRHALREPGRAAPLYAALTAERIRLTEPTLFIGFAETATALGHSVYDAFEGSVSFLHTTREEIAAIDPLIRFEEEHSHAASHRCYAADPGLFRQASRIVLVDDEITTGNTALNIIRDIYDKFGTREFAVVSLLDWRGGSDRGRFASLEAELGVRIACVSLVGGEIRVAGQPVGERASAADGVAPEASEAPSFAVCDLTPFFAPSETDATYMRHTGRFGLDEAGRGALESELAAAAERLRATRTGSRALCLGTGEFMYVPMRLAAMLGETGETLYQSTTRSPIHPADAEQYAVRSAYSFDCPDDPGIANFMYNIPPGFYDEVFVFLERQRPGSWRRSFERALAGLGVPLVHFVYFGRP